MASGSQCCGGSSSGWAVPERRIGLKHEVYARKGFRVWGLGFRGKGRNAIDRDRQRREGRGRERESERERERERGVKPLIPKALGPKL